MKQFILILLLVVVMAIAAGIVVIHRQGTHACVTYYTKDGLKEVSRTCR